jgi:hypothetical protein
VAQLQSGENNITFNHLREIGSELKLTDFQEKSCVPKNSIIAPRLVLQAVGAGDYSYTGSSQDHFGKHAYKNKLTQRPIPPMTSWAQTS